MKPNEVDLNTSIQRKIDQSLDNLFHDATLRNQNVKKDIEYEKLKRHIEKLHPTKVENDERVSFGVCENLGSLLPFKNWQGATTPMARQLGAGPTLFLLQTKAIAWFFLFLSILNLPVFASYYYGREDAEQGSTGSIFTDFSLGNVGSSHIVCGVSRYAGIIYGYNTYNADYFDSNKTIQLTCSDGAVLGDIIQFGLTKDQTSSCGNVEKTPQRLKSQFHEKFSFNPKNKTDVLFQQFINNRENPFGAPSRQLSNENELKTYQRKGEEICFSYDQQLCIKLDPSRNIYDRNKASENEQSIDYGAYFVQTPNNYLNQGSKTIENLSVLECQRKCFEEKEFYCKSFDFMKRPGGKGNCILSSWQKTDTPDDVNLYQDNRYNYYERNGEDNPEFLRGKWGSEYRGTQTASIFGNQCQSWYDMKERGKEIDDSLLYENNFCRNPDESKYIWCYVEVDGKIDKEPCFPRGNFGDFAEDYYFGPHLGLQYLYRTTINKAMSERGMLLQSKNDIIKSNPESKLMKEITSHPNYIKCGKKSKTVSGQTCKKWNSITLSWERVGKCTKEVEDKCKEIKDKAAKDKCLLDKNKCKKIDWLGPKDNDNYCRKVSSSPFANGCFVTNNGNSNSGSGLTVVNQFAQCPAENQAEVQRCQQNFVNNYRVRKYHPSDEIYFNAVVSSVRFRIETKYKKGFYPKFTEMMQWNRLFQNTVDLPQTSRPQDWFTFEYSIACRGKERCQFSVAVGDNGLQEMTPSWVQSSKKLKLTQEDQVKWSFTPDSTKEIRDRFIKGKGYLYWHQFIETQPDLMVVAECVSKKVTSPFSIPIKKRNKCPAGQDCLVYDKNYCPVDADTCVSTADGYRYAYYNSKVIDGPTRFYKATDLMDCINTCEFVNHKKIFSCNSAVFKQNDKACWLSSEQWKKTGNQFRGKNYDFHGTLMRLPPDFQQPSRDEEIDVYIATLDVNPTNLDKQVFIGNPTVVDIANECAKKCQQVRNECRAVAIYYENQKMMCQLMNKAFKELPPSEVRKLKYEPGSKIYSYRPYPFKVMEEFQKTSKESLGLIISFTDFLAVISLIAFQKCLKKSQKYYLAKFKSQTIELDDFTIEMTNLPCDYEYGYDEDALKACIYGHFEELIKKEDYKKKKEIQHNLALIQSQGTFQNVQKPDPKVYEIIDINFCKKENTEANLLWQMADTQSRFNQNKRKMKPELLNSLGTFKYDSVAAIKNFIYVKLLSVIFCKCNRFYWRDYWKGKLQQRETKLSNKFETLKKQYNQLQTQKGKIVSKNSSIEQYGWFDKVILGKESQKSIYKVFVTFRSSEGFDLVINAYNQYQSKWTRILTKMPCLNKLFSNDSEQDRLKEMYFFKRFPDVRETQDPGNVHWNNFGKTKAESTLRVSASKIAAFAAIFFSMVFLAGVDQWKSAVQSLVGKGMQCPPFMSKIEAHLDIRLPEDRQRGKKNCYCSQYRYDLKVLQEDFSEFMLFNQTNYENFYRSQFGSNQNFGYSKGEQNSFNKMIEEQNGIFIPDTNKHCYEWAKNYYLMRVILILSGVFIGLVNSQIAWLFRKTVDGEKQESIDSENQTKFLQTTVVQFFNIAIVVLIINFNIFEAKLFGFVNFFNGDYTSFDKRFYENIGITLQAALLTTITAQFQKFQEPIKAWFTQFMDRGMSMKYIDENNAVKTKFLLQKEVEKLYTGPEMQPATLYAQNFTYIWAVLFYSTGCPVLYPLGFIFFTLQYWYQKSLSLKYFRRSSKFSHELPIQSTSYLKVAIVMHVCMSYMMLSEEGLLPGGSSQTLINIDFELYQESRFGKIVSFFNQQWKKGHTVAYQVLILLLCLYYLAQFIYKKTLRVLLDAIYVRITQCCKCCKKSVEQDEATSGDFYKELQIDPLHDALKKANYEKTIFEMREMKAFDMTTINKYRGQGELPMKEYGDYYSMLYKRIEQINAVVYDHFNELQNVFNKSAQEWTGVDENEKFIKLLQHQERLLPKGGVNNSERCRFEGLVQSFDIINAELYKDAKVLKNTLDKNPKFTLTEPGNVEKTQNHNDTTEKSLVVEDFK